MEKQVNIGLNHRSRRGMGHKIECDVLSISFVLSRENTGRTDGNLLNKQHGKHASRETCG